MESEPFKYIVSLDRNYDYKKRKILSIKFPTSEYAQGMHNENHYQTIIFDSPKTEPEAIKAIEEYLNEPMTEEYFNTKVKDGDGHHFENWEKAKKLYKVRGDCIENHRFLEEMYYDSHQVTISCGS